VKELEAAKDKIRNINTINEEIRDMVEQERNAYNEERSKFDSDLANAKKQFETKIKIIRNKMLVLLPSGDPAHGLSLDEVIARLIELWTPQRRPGMPSTNLNASQTHIVRDN
jgi:hypothetical protein